MKRFPINNTVFRSSCVRTRLHTGLAGSPDTTQIKTEKGVQYFANNNNDKNVFRHFLKYTYYFWSLQIGPFQITFPNIKAQTFDGFDYAPAGTTPAHKTLSSYIHFLSFIFNYSFGYLNVNDAFSPLICGLDINTSWLFYNAKANDLFWINPTTEHPIFNVLTNANHKYIFGFPHIKHSTNHYNITPFDAVCAGLNKNYEHGSNPELDLVQFAMGETAPADLKIQNRTIGANPMIVQLISPITHYLTHFEARNTITAGNEVQDNYQRTPPGDYIIGPYGYSEFRAGERITLKPGFKASNGSYFRAYIDPYPANCNAVQPLAANKMSGNSNNDENIGEWISVGSKTNNYIPKIKENFSITENNNTLSALFYPNPSNGLFSSYISLPEVEPYSIILTDILGKTIYQKQFYPDVKENIMNFNLTNHDAGFYVITIKTESGKQYSEKIIINSK